MKINKLGRLHIELLALQLQKASYYGKGADVDKLIENLINEYDLVGLSERVIDKRIKKIKLQIELESREETW